MNPKFSEDVIPLSEVKINPGKVIKHVTEVHRPVLLTSRGRGVAIVQSLSDYEADAEERNFLHGVVQGLLDLEESRELSLAAVKKHFGL
jgi:prevent-host-death family protein